MKKFAVLITSVTMVLFSSGLHAAPKGTGSAAGIKQGSNCCAWSWALGLGALGVVAAISGVVATSSSGDPNTFSHS